MFISENKKHGQHTVVVTSPIQPSADSKSDDILLAELGYRAEFRREFSLLETMAFTFSIMAVCAGVSTSFSFPLYAGGHVGMVWGWFIPCLFVLCVAASMAELVSAMPTSAGLYYWSARLAPPRYSALASWITGWANITGQVTLICSIDFTCAQMIGTTISVGTSGRIVLSPGATYGLLIAILISHAIICSAGSKIMARLTLGYAFLNMATTIAAIVALLVCSGSNKVSTHDAFKLFENNTGWSNNGWSFLLSFACPMWILTGYDSAAHISEETAGAARSAPLAILIGVGSTQILGWLLLIAASFATKSVSDLINTSTESAIMPMAQLWLDVMGKGGMLTLWILVTLVMYVCGTAQGTDASRVIFAFGRDNGLPGSRWWKKINHRTQTPVNAVWLVYTLAGICGLLGFSNAAFSSLADASVIGLYASYATPIFLRVTSGRKTFVHGAFHLGRFSIPVGSVAVAWVAFIIVLLFFPSALPANPQNMNYAVLLVMAVFIFATTSWIVSAHKWFKGPIPNIGEDSESASSSEETKFSKHTQ